MSNISYESLPENVHHKINSILYDDVTSQMSSTIPKDEGNFNTITHFEDYERTSLQNMYNAISKRKLWDWMRTPPPANTGFMFYDHPNITLISNDVNSDGHSGSSFAWCMRNMQYIAEHGWTAYVKKISP